MNFIILDNCIIDLDSIMSVSINNNNIFHEERCVIYLKGGFELPIPKEEFIKIKEKIISYDNRK